MFFSAIGVFALDFPPSIARKKAHSGPVTCSDAGHTWNPCAVRDGIGRRFDEHLRAACGDSTEWTMWFAMNDQPMAAAWDRGLILVRKFIAPRRPLFTLIEYDDPTTLDDIATGVRWSQLSNIQLPPNMPWQMSTPIKHAVATLKRLGASN